MSKKEPFIGPLNRNDANKMSQQQPLIGPRNADPAERGYYKLSEFLEKENLAFVTAGLSIALAFVGKSLLKIETLPIGSVKKGLQTFAVISVSGLAAHYANSNMKK